MKEKVILFGSGKACENFLSKNTELYDVLMIADNNKKKWGTFFYDYEIISPEKIINLSYDFILIASDSFEDIKKQLVNDLKIPEKKIKTLSKHYMKKTLFPFENKKTYELAKKNLLFVCDILEKNNINYFIDHGTLLGVVRDGDLIPWDDDIDITVYLDDFEKLIQVIKKNLKNFPDNSKIDYFYFEKYGNNYELNGVYISFNNKTEFLIPFIITFKFIYFENDIAKSYITDSKDKYFKNYEYLTYNNSKIRAPFDYKNYLYDLYGDWKIVKKDFSFSDILTFKENSLKKSYRIYFDINSIISFSINIKKVLFLYDIYFEKSAYYNHILNFLKHKKIFSFGIDYSNPDFEDIFELLNKIKNNKFDSIIALGGGSVLDTLKAVCCFHGLNIEKIDDLRQCIITKNYLNNESKYLKIAIPTTAGTGSEVTPWATIWDKEKNQKYSIEKNELIPQKVFLISDITTSMPLKITVSTALDALSHALEAYWSKRTTDKVRENSLKSINLIVENLPSLIDDLTNIKLRERMLKASFYAGLAFSKTKTTSCHSISYPLTMKYNIPHGVAVSMTLAELLEINYSALVNPDDLFQAFGCDSVIEIKKWINLIYNKAGIKYKLRDYGVKKEELENLADLCFTPGRMDNNPVSLSKENVLFVLKNIL